MDDDDDDDASVLLHSFIGWISMETRHQLLLQDKSAKERIYIYKYQEMYCFN